MISQGLLQAIRVVGGTGNFRSVFDYFSEDVEFSVLLEFRSPTRSAIRGRQSVIRHLQNLNGTDSQMIETPVDIFGDGERIVTCRNAIGTIEAGATIGSECTLVFDIRKGLIRRLAVHHELSTALEGHPTILPLTR